MIVKFQMRKMTIGSQKYINHKGPLEKAAKRNPEIAYILYFEVNIH